MKTIAIDWDGTLCFHNPGDPIEKDGKAIMGPLIPKMSKRVKKWINKGYEVVIFTARVHDDPKGIQKAAIQQVCKKEFGKELEVTNVKRPGFHRFYDDRARGVIRNTGIVIK